jgi:hypothetical protein
VNRQNVVPFASSARGALARRGAPDKARLPQAGGRARVDLECPRCSAILRVDAVLLATDPEILCAGCDESFSLYRGEAAAD